MALMCNLIIITLVQRQKLRFHIPKTHKGTYLLSNAHSGVAIFMF